MLTITVKVRQLEEKTIVSLIFVYFQTYLVTDEAQHNFIGNTKSINIIAIK